MSPFTSVVETGQDLYDAAITTALGHLDAGTRYTDYDEFSTDFKTIEVAEKEGLNLHARDGEFRGANGKAAFEALEPQGGGKGGSDNA